MGLPGSGRRRARGLRREEVAALADVSADYYARIEQGRGAVPSGKVLGALARALLLGAEERDHLFRLAGRLPPERASRAEVVSDGVRRILERLRDTPCVVFSSVAETLAQTPAAVVLLGDTTAYSGLSRSAVHRWFALPDVRERCPAEDRRKQSRAFVSELREVYTREGSRSRAGLIVSDLLDRSEEFAVLWDAHEIGLRAEDDVRRFVHPAAGLLTLRYEVLFTDDRSQALVVYTAAPGSRDEKVLRDLTALE
ncbi:helix-turn-helix domain-containing protein [Actinocorallia sp. A-T 12471]|uniref:MmyB family transcriptional regulator n=1 Tax=Actinocorallia sp. A-T 12471 TaxID=3089813 RepID=UPI0039B6FCFF